ncbi:hypothetical protein [Pseudomonas fildesensis]|uniref:hypothetical protein n=1 Tax=Pseudomonas fildesensis TaxID=1674920 RepID=UPI001F166BFA|nr:hypothetical protein [Pseudomonas fildesensis]
MTKTVADRCGQAAHVVFKFFMVFGVALGANYLQFLQIRLDAGPLSLGLNSACWATLSWANECLIATARETCFAWDLRMLTQEKSGGKAPKPSTL